MCKLSLTNSILKGHLLTLLLDYCFYIGIGLVYMGDNAILLQTDVLGNLCCQLLKEFGPSKIFIAEY